MDGQMDGQTKYMDGWMDKKIDGWLEGRITKIWKNRWMVGRKDNKNMEKQMNGWLDGQKINI